MQQDSFLRCAFVSSQGWGHSEGRTHEKHEAAAFGVPPLHPRLGLWAMATGVGWKRIFVSKESLSSRILRSLQRLSEGTVASSPLGRALPQPRHLDGDLGPGVAKTVVDGHA